MAVLTRIVAAATLVSIALVDIAGATAAENYAIAAQRARARSHHERAAHIDAAGRENRKRSAAQKRCKAPTTTSTLAATTSHKVVPTSPPSNPEKEPTTSAHPTTVKTTEKASSTSTKAPAETSQAPPKPPSGGSFGNKRLIAWSGTNDQLENVLKKYPGNYAGVYNWGANPPDVGGLDGWSMLWGYKNEDDFRKYRSQFPILMGPNEFNLGSQSDLSVPDLVALWNKEVRPFIGGKKAVIAPSATTAPSGISDLQEFFKTCGGDDHCGATHMSAHPYSKDSADVIKYATQLHETFGLPVAITETACQSFVDSNPDCTAAEATTFMNEVLDFVDSTDWVSVVSFYGWAADLGNVNQQVALMDDNGNPTALGKKFLGV